jgi:hypothetical protein
MPTIVASYSPIQGVSAGSEIMEYGVVKTICGESRVFLIYFVRDADGVWRIGGM